MTDVDHPYLRTLFLHPPSYEGFDGGAGARYQARREIRSFWYPTWLAQPAALVPGSRLIDAPPADLALEDIRPSARLWHARWTANDEEQGVSIATLGPMKLNA